MLVYSEPYHVPGSTKAGRGQLRLGRDAGLHGQMQQRQAKRRCFNWVLSVHEPILIRVLALMPNTAFLLDAREKPPWMEIARQLVATEPNLMNGINDSTVRNLKERKCYTDEPGRWDLVFMHAAKGAGLIPDVEVPPLKYGPFLQTRNFIFSNDLLFIFVNRPVYSKWSKPLD